jgi:hypothetical protein
MQLAVAPNNEAVRRNLDTLNYQAEPPSAQLSPLVKCVEQDQQILPTTFAKLHLLRQGESIGPANGAITPPLYARAQRICEINLNYIEQKPTIRNGEVAEFLAASSGKNRRGHISNRPLPRSPELE